MALDLTVSRILTQLHVVERALHDSSAIWTIQMGHHSCVASCSFGDNYANFHALFPPIAVTQMYLSCNGTSLLAQEVTVDESEPFTVDWKISVTEAGKHVLRESL
jgi:hypothetical protein